MLTQDSYDDISQCVAVVLKTRQGSRVEVPGFGTPDPTFLTPRQVMADALASQIETWEPRAEVTVTHAPHYLDDSRRDVQVYIAPKVDVVDTGGFEGLGTDSVVAQPGTPTDSGGTPQQPSGPSTWDGLGTLTWDGSGNLTWNTI